MAAGSDSPPGGRSKRWLAGALALAAAVFGVYLWLAGGRETASATLTAAAAPSPLERTPAPGWQDVATAAALPAAPDAPLAPIIDELELEKEEVCEGEENLVTVRAHTAGGREDEYLHAIVGGTPGMSVPVLGRRGDSTPRFVTVFGRDNVATTVPLPPFRVKDCAASRFVVIERRLRPNTEAELELRARLLDTNDSPLVPDHWVWDFGDGTQLETAEPYAVHDYGRRPQEALYSHFLLRVEAVAADGERALGRSSLELRNEAYTNLLYAGVVTLMIELDPRFPVLDDDGVVRQTVRLWHHDDAPVRIRKATARRNFDDERPPETAAVDPAKLLGGTVVPPSGLAVRVRLDTRREPGVFSIDYELEGETAAGRPVRGAFSTMVPPRPPTRDTSTPVNDPLMRARIRRAMSLLGKELVSEAELQSLELQGAFDDLRVPAVGPGQAPRYGDLPPHPPRRDEPSPGELLPRADEMPVYAPEVEEP